MDPSHIAEAAALLVAARQQRSRIGLLPEVCRPRSVADAHAIQDAVTAVLGATVGATVGALLKREEACRGENLSPTDDHRAVMQR